MVLPQRVMERELACDQLRSAGLLSAVQISRVGFPSRLSHAQLLANCAVLVKALPAAGAQSNDPDDAEAQRNVLRCYNANDASSAPQACKALLSLTIGRADPAALDQVKYAVGKTKVFLRAGLLSELSVLCNVQLGLVALTIQRYARGWLCRLAKKHAELAEQQRNELAAITIQACVRGKLARITWAAKCEAEAARVAAEETAKAEAQKQKRAQEEAEKEAAMKAAAGDAAAEKQTLQGQLASEQKLRMGAEAELVKTRKALSTAQKALEVKTAALQAAESTVAELCKQLAKAQTTGTDNVSADSTEPRPMTPKSDDTPQVTTASAPARRRTLLEARLHKVKGKHSPLSKQSESDAGIDPPGPPPDRPGWQAAWSSQHKAWYWWDITTLETTWVDPASQTALSSASASRATELLDTPNKGKAKQQGKRPPTHRPRSRR
eukprot:COSAG02_NODE_3965_length_5977_cov_9.580810_2_plen_438_part_00